MANMFNYELLSGSCWATLKPYNSFGLVVPFLVELGQEIKKIQTIFDTELLYPHILTSGERSVSQRSSMPFPQCESSCQSFWTN